MSYVHSARNGKRYELRQATIRLRGGKQQPIRFFARVDQSEAPTERIIRERPRQQLLPGSEVIMTRMMGELGIPPLEAARLMAKFKADTEGLPQWQIPEITARILSEIDQEV